MRRSLWRQSARRVHGEKLSPHAPARGCGRRDEDMSASLVRATVRAVSKRKLQPTRAALTLVSHLGVRGEVMVAAAAARGAEQAWTRTRASRRAASGARWGGRTVCGRCHRAAGAEDDSLPPRSRRSGRKVTQGTPRLRITSLEASAPEDRDSVRPGFIRSRRHRGIRSTQSLKRGSCQ